MSFDKVLILLMVMVLAGVRMTCSPRSFQLISPRSLIARVNLTISFLFFSIPPEMAKPGFRNDRSEEHTSELKSLMRTSYAALCFKQTNQHIISRTTSRTPQKYN